MDKLTAEELNDILPYLFGDEIKYLKALANSLDDESIIMMLGVGPAIMAMAMLEDTKKTLYLYGIDIDKQCLEYARKHLNAAGVSPHNAILIQNSSLVEATYWEDESIDVLLVDADHSYEAVRADIEAWWPKVRKGGIVFFHDYEKKQIEDNGVEEAVEESRGRYWKEIERPGISIVFQKVK